MPGDAPPFDLDATQEIALDQLIEHLRALAERLDDQAPTPEELSRGASYKPLDANVFGILGARGSGKSTLMLELYRRWECQADQRLAEVFLLPLMDCSVLPSEIAPGAAVLLRLKKSLETLGRIDNKRNHETNTRLMSELDQLIGRYTRTGKGYHDLSLDLSSSPEDYSQYVVEGLSERFELGTALAHWLCQASSEARRPVGDPGPRQRNRPAGHEQPRQATKAFVVLLDDFDLVPAQEVRRWLLALLDELHQHRVFFVLTADYHRLEYLSWDAKAQVDDKTGRAMLNKLLPVQHRFTLPIWKAENREPFKPDGEHPRTLWDLVSQILEKHRSSEPLIACLLPSLPRGLRDLYFVAKALADLEPGQAGEEPAQTKLYSFLAHLASCRSEPLFSRHLGDSTLDDWARELSFPDRELSSEEWRELVDTAGQRPNWKLGKTLKPLRGLHPIARPEPRSTGNKETENLIRLLAEFPDTWNRNPAWQDPLRHDWLRIQPLRDVKKKDQPLWCELLIDLGLGDSALRMRFVDTWKPLTRRLEATCLLVPREAARVRALFEDNSSLITHDLLFWLAPESAEDGNGRLVIGWAPLLAALRGSRDPLSPELFGDMRFSLGTLKEDRDAAQSVAKLDILPGELWALILLVDALDHVPWTALSAPVGWSLATSLGLAAAMVRTAYLLALTQSGQIDETQLIGGRKKGAKTKKRTPDATSAAQLRFLGDLRQRDPRRLLRLQDDELLIELDDLFAENAKLKTELAKHPSSLMRAALAYLDSPAYRSAVRLVTELAGWERQLAATET